jgi:hypothetical protein
MNSPLRLLPRNICAILSWFALAMNQRLVGFDPARSTLHNRLLGALPGAIRSGVKQSRSSHMPQVSGDFGSQ